MSQNHHTPIVLGAPGTPATVNAPLGTLDSALTEINTQIVTIQDTYIPNLPNVQFHCEGAVTWNKSTKVLSFGGPGYLFHARVGLGALTTIGGSGGWAVDFSGKTQHSVAYISGIVVGTSQTFDSATDIKIESYTTVSRAMTNKDVVVLAWYDHATNSCHSPFIAAELSKNYLLGTLQLNSRNYQFQATSPVAWNQATSVFTLNGNTLIYHSKAGVNGYTAVGSNKVLDFSAIKAAVKYGVAYFSGITPGSFQDYSAVAATIEPMDNLTHNMTDKDVIVLAWYNYDADSCQSPFIAAQMERTLLSNTWPSHMSNMGVLTSYHLWWDQQATKLWTTGVIYLYNGQAANPVMVIINAPVTGQPLIDFSSVAGSYAVAYITGYVAGTPMTITPATDIHVTSYDTLGAHIYAPGTIVLAEYSPKTGDRPGIQGLLAGYMVESDFALGRIARPEAWFNRYPSLGAKFPLLRAKKLARTGHVRIVMWGESIFADATLDASLVPDPTVTPPSMEGKHVGWHLWKRFGMDQGVYRRSDYTGYFTLTGTPWASIRYDANWDDSSGTTYYRNFLTAWSNATGAAFAWTLATGTGNTGCNLIYRTDTSGDAAATITATEGAGYLEYWNGAAWVEANGATINMKEVDEGVGYGNTRIRRLNMRKAVAHRGDSVTITIGKASADADRLLFWGVELYDEQNGQRIVHVDNRARGSHNIDSLNEYIVDDCTDGLQNYPDLILYEFTSNTIQSYGATLTPQQIVDKVQDQVWGDRGGHANANALFQLSQTGASGHWDKFDPPLVIIPHFRNDDLDGTSHAFKLWGSGYTTQQYYEAIKAYLITRGDVPFIDLSSASLRECDALPEFINYFDFTGAGGGGGGSGDAYGKGIGYVHLNDHGVEFYCKHIIPIFDFNTA